MHDIIRLIAFCGENCMHIHWRRKRGGGRGGMCPPPPPHFWEWGDKYMFVPPPPLSDPEFRPRHRAYWYLWRHFGVACIDHGVGPVRCAPTHFVTFLYAVDIGQNLFKWQRIKNHMSKNAMLDSQVSVTYLFQLRSWSMCPPFCSHTALSYFLNGPVDFLTSSRVISSHFSRIFSFSSFSVNFCVRPL